MKKIFLFLIALVGIVACSKSDSGSSDNGGYALKLLKSYCRSNCYTISE